MKNTYTTLITKIAALTFCCAIVSLPAFAFDIPGIKKKEPKENKSESNASSTSSNDEGALASLEPMIDKALEGYNKKDSKAFFADYAKKMASIATDQVFNTMYMDDYMKNLGKYKSKTLIKKETVLMGDFPLVVYTAEMEKGKAKISVNFTKEEGSAKIMQFRIDKL